MHKIKEKNFFCRRRPDQLYVWMTMVSSATLLLHGNLKLSEFDDFFNLTATPR